MFTVHLRRHMQSNTDYISVIHDVFEIINSTGKGKRLLIESNVLNQILTFALDVAMNEDGHLVERQVALACAEIAADELIAFSYHLHPEVS